MRTNNSQEMKGIYLLFLQLDESQPISIGRLGVQQFTMGFNAYVNSALNGLEARVTGVSTVRRSTSGI